MTWYLLAFLHFYTLISVASEALFVFVFGGLQFVASEALLEAFNVWSLSFSGIACAPLEYGGISWLRILIRHSKCITCPFFLFKAVVYLVLSS